MLLPDQFKLVDDNFPECGIDCTDWIEKFNNVLSTFKNDGFARVVLLSEKNAFSLSMIYAATELGFPYIPIDINSPLNRIKNILDQIEPEIYFIQKKSIDYKNELFKDLHIIWESNNFLIAKNLSKTKIEHSPHLAFILFTSGSTGIPKGVMISKNNANCFVDWTIKEFNITNESKILSVAPLHFDLSVFDLFASQKANATLFLPLQNLIMNPLYLAQLISIYKINTIYATPTWFTLLMQYGKLKKYDYSFVKTILIAGEALKVKTVEELHSFFPNAKISNLYGPTETNVCTFYTVNFSVPILNHNQIVSIGNSCPYATVKQNHENVLEVSGESVMLGYWPNKFKDAFYNTGDVVSQDEETKNYFYLERADRMIKRNGYRIEPFEIEIALGKYDQIIQVAVTSKVLTHTTEISAHYTAKSGDKIGDLYQYCLNHIPPYMIPDKFILHSQLPLTSSGKTDYKKLMDHK